jgi:nucleoside-diphosphate-sugar epimerase
MRVLIVGCGYVGLALGADLVRRGHEVHGMRRTAASSAQLLAAGITPITTDITQPLEGKPVTYDWVVNCVSSSKGDAADYRAVYLHGTRNLLTWLAAAPPKKLVYTSSTSVYGQTDGSEVDETSPTTPASETGEILVATERVLFEQSGERGIPAASLRVAGIYGPERGHWLKQFLAGAASIEGTGERILNMVHRQDVVGAIVCALERGRAGEIYNVVDNEPVTQIEFFRWLAETVKRALPPVSAEASSLSRKRGLTNKRVSNQKLKTELGYRLEFPTFREGCLAELKRLGAA